MNRTALRPVHYALLRLSPSGSEQYILAEAGPIIYIWQQATEMLAWAQCRKGPLDAELIPALEQQLAGYEAEIVRLAEDCGT